MISKQKLNEMPFLKEWRTDDDVDVSTLSASARRALSNEERVKGDNKVIVRVQLADSSGLVLSSLTSRQHTKWVVRRRVPTKDLPRYQYQGNSALSLEAEKNPSGNGTGRLIQQKNKRLKIADSKPKYVGDGNDTESQQESNWRWLASRFDPCSQIRNLSIQSGIYGCMLSNFVGEVVSVTAEPPTSSSLAIVTVRCIVLPEQTTTGRMPHHKLNEAYYDLDAQEVLAMEEKRWQHREAPLHYRIPVEELIIISKPFENNSIPSVGSAPKHGLLLTQSYSRRRNIFREPYLSAGDMNISRLPQFCCRCRRAVEKEGMEYVKTTCQDCSNIVKRVFQNSLGSNPDLSSACDCRECRQASDLIQRRVLFDNAIIVSQKTGSYSNAQMPPDEQGAHMSSEFVQTRNILKHLEMTSAFSLTSEYLTLNQPSSKPITGTRKRASKNCKVVAPVMSTEVSPWSSNGNPCKQESAMERNEHVVETCSRIFAYDRELRTFDVPHVEPKPGQQQECSGVRDRERNQRLNTAQNSSVAGENKEESGINSRALRANQRRLLRDVAAIGVNVDNLAGRALSGYEQYLRFDRSRIHAWGVFADKDIKENDMLVEYRGEIIGNSMCEKREREYEMAKIGSDYMFRVDGLSVCDATKQGNVARFINHSCDPNCFTKIISIEGNRRIVVYGKRDIAAGEELSYDYKFPLEYDDRKRIPCHCGTTDCRGFMNWVSTRQPSPPVCQFHSSHTPTNQNLSNIQLSTKG